MGFSCQTLQAQAFSYEMVTVGDAGNRPSVYGYGEVNWEYQIGTYEVTIQQYADFLNAVAVTEDPYDLYDQRMASDLNSAGILRTSGSSGYIYTVMDNGGNSASRPITYVSWYDAARFANWMANGQPIGVTASGTSTEDGAYELFGMVSGTAPVKNTINPNTGEVPVFYIPSEDEWYKAAFYSQSRYAGVGGYFQYATQTDATPGNVIGGDSNQVNYIFQPPGTYSVTQDTELSPSQNYLTDVGSFFGSASYYGTFDQNGNVWEVTDSAYGTDRSLMVARGGGWTSYDNYLWDSYRLSLASSSESSNGGFRLAAPVPEPSLCALALAGLAGALFAVRRRGGRVAILAAALLGSILGDGRADPIDYQMTAVGDAGNTASPATGLGSVNADYQIGVYDVTIQQYTDFLNAVAVTADPFSLYNPSMATDLNVAGILRTSGSNGYTYSVIDNGGVSGNRPVTYVSWFDAARFANWMANGQPVSVLPSDASTENGAYDLSFAFTGIAPSKNTINPNTGEAPLFYIPTEDEWYKAAFYSPDYNGTGSAGYYTYATQNDDTPGNSDFSGTNQVNIYVGKFAVTQSNVYSDSQNYLTDVGAFFNSESYYGTFDQNGNVYQWNDLDGTSNASRGLIGGFWFGGPNSAASTTISSQAATYEGNDVGFRLAAPVPEPGVSVLAALAGMALLVWSRRKAGP